MIDGLFIFYSVGVCAIVGMSGAAYYLIRGHAMKRMAYGVMIFLMAASTYMVGAQYLKYLSLHYYTDFASWTHLLNNIARTGRPISLIEAMFHPGCMNYLSAHFVPLIYILALPFKIWPYSETVIIINSIVMLSSVVPLYKIAVHNHGDRRFGLFMATLLLWYPTFQYIVLYEFDMLRFSIPAVLWMLYFWERKKTILYFSSLLIAALVREEVGLTLAAFGLYIMFVEKAWRRGLATTVIGLAAFIIITGAVMPSLRTGADHSHIAIGHLSAFGKTPHEIITGIFLHPARVASIALDPIKLANLVMFFLPLLGIPFLALSALVPIIPNTAVCLLSSGNTNISYMLYYMAPSIPFILYAFIKGWPAFTALLSPRVSHGDVQSAAMMIVLAGIFTANVFFGPSPFSLQFWFKNLTPAPFQTQNFHYTSYIVTDRHRIVDEFCNVIPDAAVVSSNMFLFPRLFKKRCIMTFPWLESKDGSLKAEYILFDSTNNGLKEGSPAYVTQRQREAVLQNGTVWEPVKSRDGYFLFRKKQ